mmetsp:Transcript_85292/g.198294  ORF Transcript_85292/g.198294 Transcript_85292/m.198294 type:complete len:738 (+) Transcript_85292:136-2349(+)
MDDLAATNDGNSSSLFIPQDDVSTFARELNLDAEAVGFMRELPVELRASIMANFDPTGTKDGNVLGRLQAYVKHMMRRSGLQPMEYLNGFRSHPERKELHAQPPVIMASGGMTMPLEMPGIANDAVWRFVEQLGLGEAAADLLNKLPEDLQSNVLRGFNPSGTKDGNVWGRLLGYVRSLWSRRLGLTEPASTFIRSLPEDVQVAVIADFDASGSKDGNVSARLMQFANYLIARSGTARSPVGAAPTNLRSAAAGAAPGGLRSAVSQAAVAQQLPQQLAQQQLAQQLPQQQLLEQVSQQQLPQQVAQQQLQQLQQQQLPQQLAQQQLHEQQFHDQQLQEQQQLHEQQLHEQQLQQQLQQQQLPQQQLTQQLPQQLPQLQLGQQLPLDAQQFPPESAMSEFALTLGLDASATTFLQALPEYVQSTVITQFDPSGTKDGNIWGRLFAFVRRVCVKYAGVSQAHIDHIKGLSEEEQKRIILEWTCPPQRDSTPLIVGNSGLEGGSTTEATIRSFSQAWGLDVRAECFLQALPEPIRQHVLTGFDGSGTKDGNVWGRLLGFARHTWARSLGLDQASVAFIKGLPEEAQMICLTDFDPSGTKDGNIAGRLQGFAKKALAQAGQLARAPGGDPNVGHAAVAAVQLEASAARFAAPMMKPSLSSDPLVVGFLERCGLDVSTLSYLESLPEDVLTRVLNEFDPSGTKDGNVLGRLQGYVRFLNARRKRSDEDPGALQAKRQRYAGV